MSESIIQEIDEIKKKSVKSRTLDKYFNEFEVEEVLTGRSSFEYQLESFYGLRDEIVVANQSSNKKEKNHFRGEVKVEEKEANIPKKLIDILSEFSEKKFDEERLEYDKVRYDYVIWDNHSVMYQRCKALALLSIPVSAGLLGAFHPDITGSVAFLTTFLGGLVSLGGADFYSNADFVTPKHTNKEFLDYKALKEVAIKADEYVRDIYRAEMIENKVYQLD